MSTILIADAVAELRALAAAPGVGAGAEPGRTARERLDALTVHRADPTEVDLLRLALLTGLVEGFIDRAADVLLSRARPWHEAGVETADEDPHTRARFGQAYAVRSAVGLLLDDALSAVTEGHDRADDTVRLARAHADLRGGDVINDLVSVLGASSATTALGLDGWWRAIRGVARDLPARPVALPSVPTAPEESR